MIGDDVRVEDTFTEIINHYKSRDCVGCPFRDVSNICDRSECRWEQVYDGLYYSSKEVVKYDKGRSKTLVRNRTENVGR